ncbi:MAG: formate dehydrogenase accessory sulfurtransferase FdhD [Pyrinomonadaceae bacterium]|nr:formate dehydrogenase accessory sulfurtransferase FdhD [Pyrinomonadaceae bacterium]
MNKSSNQTEQSCADVRVQRVQGDDFSFDEQDSLAVEEPLEIRIGIIENGKRSHKSISITMRTPNVNPNSDFELAAGFLFTEGIIQSCDQIQKIHHCGLRLKKGAPNNTVRVDLKPEVTVDFKKLERHFYTSSSCGVCGKTSIEALQTGACSIIERDKPIFNAELIHKLPEILRTRQNVFEKTGGLHAAALFDDKGNLETLREDVGRHNAVDKLIGTRFLANETPLDHKLLLVSGRASFELVQKALMGGIPILAAVGAPSSLAVELAKEFGMTILGFVRNNRFNIYAGAQRIRSSNESGGTGIAENAEKSALTATM